MRPELTRENITILVMVLMLLLYVGATWGVQYFIQFVADRVTRTWQVTPSLWQATPAEVHKHSRLASAGVVMQMANGVLKIAVALTMADGLFKAFTDVLSFSTSQYVQLLGLTLLICYGALISTYAVIRADVGAAIRDLLLGTLSKGAVPTPASGSGGATAPTPTVQAPPSTS